MKRTCIIFLIIVIGLSLTNIVFADTNDVYHWKMQTMTVITSLESTILLPAFCDRVREMSNGRLNITLYNAGELTPSLEVADSLRVGMIDISYGFPTYFTGIIPETAVDLPSLPPLIFESTEDMCNIYWYGGLDDIIREGFDKYGIHFLGTLPMDNPVSFWSKKPMYSMGDLKGFKVRTYGYIAKTFKKLGASPIFIPHEEVYTAISQGTADGSQTGVINYEALRLYEVAPYFYSTSELFGPVTGCLMVSNKSWDALPYDLKAVVEAANAQLKVDHITEGRRQYEDVLSKFDDWGVTVIQWSKEDTQKMREAAMSFLPEIAAINDGTKKAIEIIRGYLREKGHLK